VLIDLLDRFSDDELQRGGARAECGTDMDVLQRRIGEWAEATFPHHTDLTVFKHLLEEVDELTDAYHEWGTRPRMLDEEAADVVILLMTLLNRRGISLAEAVRAKQAINEGRAWSPPGENGIAHHVGHRRES
jgi:NTP pyrophosphatase (non-canonical NTP hydrolase)